MSKMSDMSFQPQQQNISVQSTLEVGQSSLPEKLIEMESKGSDSTQVDEQVTEMSLEIASKTSRELGVG